MSDVDTEQPARPKSDWGVTLALGFLAAFAVSLVMSGVKPLIAPMLKDNASLRNWVGIVSWLFVLGAAGGVMLWRRRVKRKWLLIVFLLLWAGTYGTIENILLEQHIVYNYTVDPSSGALSVEQNPPLQTLHLVDGMEMYMKTFAFTTLAALLPTLALGFALRLHDKRKLSKEIA